MPYVSTAINDLENGPLVGNGDCVTLVKEKTHGLRAVSTTAWREGQRVVGSTGLQRGTAIATFEDGRYPNRQTGNHAAIFLAYAGKSIWVLDQWKSDKKKRVERRLIRPALPGANGRFADPSNSADAFSVIELAQ